MNIKKGTQTENRIKVLYIIDSFQVGGAEKSLLDISSHLSGAEAIVCGVYKRDDLLPDFKKNGILTYHLNVDGKYNWLTAYSKLCEIIEKESPDVIHATLFRSCILSRFVGKRYKLPIINSIVSDSYGIERLSLMQPLRRIKHYYTLLLDKFTAKKVDQFISNSESVKKSYASNIGVELDKIETIYRGRQAAKFLKNDASIREELLPNNDLNDKFLFICVGRLVESKGHLLLLEAFQRLVQKHLDARILIVGEGPFRQVIEDYISNNSLKEKVILLGNREDIPALLNLSDAFVTSTYYEGLSGAIIEAMFSSLPVIASDIEPNLELINSDRGWTFKKGDSSDLYNKMELLLLQSNSDICVKTAKSLKFATEHLEISSVAEKYIDTYSKLINENTICRYKAN